MSGAIRVLVADDETSARKRLLQFLGLQPGVTLAGEACNGLEACEQIARLQPDLVFLDVEMPELTGLEVVRRIGTANMPATIFATAYDHYALEAFDANAMDYLLKPFDQARFDAAMSKARRWLAAGPGQFNQQLGKVMAALEPAREAQDRILVKSGEVQHLVKVADIMYISAEGNYVRLHTAAGEHLMRERMAGILERLDGALFRRIHRSHIVNLDHVKKLLPWFGGDSLVMMADGCRLTLSRNHRDALRDFA
ncbi:MAG TPA: LytTR family DNA-binding domain-containing protein [Telluria sp.]|jgi:two-component system LytT family response regulator|nr:LytTR family DNA-binding domain-containing protein [Telluria sp.]